MDTAPTGGKPVWLLGALELPCGWLIPICQGAYHYATRQRARNPIRWVETEWWCPINAPRAPIPFDPIGWQRYQ